MTLPEIITAALLRSPDYSGEFTARVKALAKRLEADLELPLSHDSNMNYRAGQYVSFKANLPQVSPKRHAKGSVEVRIYISSKGPLFAFYVMDAGGTLMEPEKASHPVPENLLPADITGQLEVCRKRLSQEGYTEVARSLFDVPAPGCTTELDDLPATVFQSLFAEII
jgi:hypothetical protein